MSKSKLAAKPPSIGDGTPLDTTASCKIAARLMSESRDRELSASERRSLNQHLGICENCARFGSQLDFLSALAGRVARGEIGRKR
jgi:hypothetical protein